MPLPLIIFLCLVPYFAIGILLAKARVKRFWNEAKYGIDDTVKCDFTSCHDNRSHIWHRCIFTVFLWLPAMPFQIIGRIVGFVSDTIDKEITKRDPFRIERELRRAERLSEESERELQVKIDRAAEVQRIDCYSEHPRSPIGVIHYYKDEESPFGDGSD